MLCTNEYTYTFKYMCTNLLHSKHNYIFFLIPSQPPLPRAFLLSHSEDFCSSEYFGLTLINEAL